MSGAATFSKERAVFVQIACNPAFALYVSSSARCAQAQGVIGGAEGGPREVEAAPALSVTLGCLPGTEVRAVRINDANMPDGGAATARLCFFSQVRNGLVAACVDLQCTRVWSLPQLFTNRGMMNASFVLPVSDDCATCPEGQGSPAKISKASSGRLA